jgi:guanosine-3',5'-bis(diphosphate) 3'-pyrophosphohydrolase
MKRDNDLWQKAASFAARAHRHQLRKDGRTPYVAHAFRVAFTLRHVFGCEDESVLAAALLHDTIEDCDIDYDDILEAFGKRVADLVVVMTKDMRLIESEREEVYDRQLADGPWEGRLIKLGDVFDNLTEAIDADLNRGKFVEKARRAVKLAESDRTLDEPRAMVERLIREAESSS